MNDFARGVAVSRSQRLTGPQSSAAWLASRGLFAPPGTKWRVTIALDDDALAPTGHLHLHIEALEWGFRFSRDNQLTWIRVKDEPTIQERDDFTLFDHTPALRNIGNLVSLIEDRAKLRFRRAHATIRTNLHGASDKIRLWVAASL